MPGKGEALTGRKGASEHNGPMRESECKSRGEAKRDLRPRWLGRGIDECGEWCGLERRGPRWVPGWQEGRQSQLGAGDADWTAGGKLARFRRALQAGPEERAFPIWARTNS